MIFFREGKLSNGSFSPRSARKHLFRRCLRGLDERERALAYGSAGNQHRDAERDTVDIARTSGRSQSVESLGPITARSRHTQRTDARRSGSVDASRFQKDGECTR